MNNRRLVGVTHGRGNDVGGNPPERDEDRRVAVCLQRRKTNDSATGDATVAAQR